MIATNVTITKNRLVVKFFVSKNILIFLLVEYNVLEGGYEMKSIDYFSLGAKIKATRKEQNYTQEQLSEICDISIGFLAHIEAGTRIPSLESIFKISRALNLSIDYLLFDTTVHDDNFIQYVTTAIQNKPAESYSRFCKIVKVLAENIDDL